MTATDDVATFSAQILSTDHTDERRLLDKLRASSQVEFIDRRDELVETLQHLRPPPVAEIITEPTRWAYYPWRRSVVGILGPRGYRALRLDRNRNLITAAEQDRFYELRIGVVGLSVGHAIAHTLAAEGLCGTIRLADFDRLELTNLNRVPATVFDIGLNKAVVAARRIAELDPYMHVEVMTSGLTPHTVDDFLDGVDVVVEECDSLEMKVMVREAARARRLPVVMATGDRGLVDVERYDLEPGRPILHDLLGEANSAHLSSLPNRDRIPYMLRHLDASRSSPRLAASLLEIGNTLSTWPQLAADVALGAATVAEAVRRVGLQVPLGSGQARIDISRQLDELAEPTAADDHHARADPPQMFEDPPTGPAAAVAAAALRAPSGGNAQPWIIETGEDSVVVRLMPEHTSLMDVNFRGSALAVGAAAFNARVAAAALSVLGPTTWRTSEEQSPLTVTLQLGHGEDAQLAALYRPMLRRETNRHRGAPQPLPGETVATLHDMARREGARLHFLQSREDMEQAANIFAATDRIRYLTPRLHKELIAELRWPGDEPADTGIDVRSLELDAAGLAALEILRRPDVMATLAQWDAGEALGDDVRELVRASSALAVLTVQGHDLIDFARGGSAAEAVWVVAQENGLAVQPISPVFLHAVDPEELCEVSPAFAATLQLLQSKFRQLASTESDESQVLVLKFAHARPASVRSRRRGLTYIDAAPLARQDPTDGI